MSNITKNLIKNPVITLIILILSSPLVYAFTGPNYPLVIPPDQIIQTKIAITFAEQKKGLSGVKSENFKSDQGLLFCFEKFETRVFWMPDTNFNLDIFFLDDDLKVLDLERNMQSHPGFSSPEKIARTRPIKAKYVLEMRSDSPHSKKIITGIKLIWRHSRDLNQTISDVRRSR